MNIPRSVLTLFLVCICFDIALTRHVRGRDKTNEKIDALRNLLLEDEIKECNEGFSYNVLTEECENDDDKSNLSVKKLINPVNVLRKLLLGERGQYQCNEGFSYNRLTRKCEDDERSNLSEKPAKPIDPVNVLRKLLLGDRGQIQCSKEGFSYNRMTGKCEDADERFNSLEKHGCCSSGAGG